MASTDVNPSISIIIPCWNAEKWIARAIQSALDQGYPNKEVIVIDDGSTDGSLDIIKSFGTKIRWKTGPNRGACAARNIGFNLSSSEYVLFLDADDYYEQGFIAGVAGETCQSLREMVIGPFVIANEHGPQTEYRSYNQVMTKTDIASTIVRFEGVQTGSVLWRRDFLQRLGGWDTKLGRLQDYFQILRALVMCETISTSEIGACVYWNHSSDQRVSRRRTVQTESSVICAYEEHLHKFSSLLTEDTKQILACQLYSIVLFLHRNSQKELAGIGFRLCQELGMRGHGGNFTHRFFCAIVGLDRKEKLSSLKRQLSHRLRQSFRFLHS